MNRRTFVVGTASLAAVSISAWYYLRGETDSAPISLSMIWDTKTITDIGTKYQLQVPAEANEKTLADLLSNMQIEDQIRKDFETDKTVLVDGWILSVTEARQCALFSITQ